MADFDDPEVDIIPSKQSRTTRIGSASSSKLKNQNNEDFAKHVTFFHQFLALVSPHCRPACANKR